MFTFAIAYLDAHDPREVAALVYIILIIIDFKFAEHIVSKFKRGG